MNLFFDTSVLVAAFVASHPHHARAFAALSLIEAGENRGWISQHTVAELYAVLTTAPVSPRIHASEALRIIDDNVLPHFQIVALEPGDYPEVIRELAVSNLGGGKIYDALHIRCALKQPIDTLYTFHVKDFRVLAPKGLLEKITAP